MVDTVNKSVIRKNNEKKSVSVACAHIKFSDITGQGVADINQLFKLPENCLITKAGIHVVATAQASLTCDFGFAGGNELGNDLDIHDAAGYVQAGGVTTLTTLTGTVTALTLTEGTPNTLDSGTVELTSGAGTNVHSPRLLTGTGKTVTAVFSAVPTEGEFFFVVEFIEYTKGNGELTAYTDGII